MRLSMLDDRRVLIGGGVLVAAVLVATSWFTFVGPTLASADAHAADREDAEVQNVVLARQNRALASQAEQMVELTADLDAVRTGLPVGTELPAFTRQVTTSAESAGVRLTDVAINPPAVVEQTNGEQSATPGDEVVGQRSIAVTVTSIGSLREQTAFLSSLQRGDRRALVGTTTVNSDEDDAGVDAASTMTAQLTLFTAS